MEKIAALVTVLMLSACTQGYEKTDTALVRIKEIEPGVYAVGAARDPLFEGGYREAGKWATVEINKKCAELGGIPVVDQAASRVPADVFKQSVHIVFRCEQPEAPNLHDSKG